MSKLDIEMSLQDHYQCVTHTEDKSHVLPRRTVAAQTHTDRPLYFVWVSNQVDCKPVPQLWYADHRTGTDTFQLGETNPNGPLFMFVVLTEKERDMSLSALAACYPYPAPEAGAC